jgi:hypothetical protein
MLQRLIAYESFRQDFSVFDPDSLADTDWYRMASKESKSALGMDKDRPSDMALLRRRTNDLVSSNTCLRLVPVRWAISVRREILYKAHPPRRF